MIGYSDTLPELIRHRAGKLRLKYDATQVEGPEGRMQFKFSYCDVQEHPTRGQIIDAIIAGVYPKDAEIALINNEIASPGTPEYAEYQAYRAHAKELAGKVLEAL